ncbi:LysR family transcriptional regulator [Luteimonas vadosa]|uniref:LysR family transcriptional regulator n=1 Tax=Luteimonas vadosa TaxID=1165507 RepID=A0ABP9DXY9_9GAMM
MAKPIHWDDLQYFLAVCEHGSLGAAARALGVNHSTVLRRIGSLEATLGVRLFDRLPAGYTLTAQGHALASEMSGVPEQVDAAQRRVVGGDLELKGSIRLTAPDVVMQSMLLPALARFRRMHPQLELELVVNSSLLNLTRREADVAVRGSNEPPPTLVGRRVGKVRVGLYASRDYLDSLGPSPSEADYQWVCLDETYAHMASAKWVREHVPPERIALKVNHLPTLADAVAAGLGVGWLLCPLGETRKDLVCLREPLPEMDTQVWVLTHRDLRRVARIRALTDLLYEHLSQDPRLVHA